MNNICLILEPDRFCNESISILKNHYLIRDLSDIKDSEYSRVEVIFCRLNFFINENFLSNYSNLKYICSPTTGLNHIDQDYLEIKGIKLISLINEVEFLSKKITSTAEYTWGLMMTSWRKIIEAKIHVASDGWNRDLFISHQIKGRNIGMVGMGRVGKQIASYIKAFDANMKYFDPFVNDILGKEDSLKTLAEWSDILIICCKYNKQNKKLISSSIINSMKINSLLVNTSRGEIIDEKELIKALKAKKIFCALDVLSNENELKDNELINLSKNSNRVIITPHIAGATIDAMHLTEKHITKLLLRELQC